MRKSAKVCTVINLVLSGILWLLGLLTLLFNLLGLWAPWHLAGFAFVFYIPVPILPAILSLVACWLAEKWKLLIFNAASVAVSVGFCLLTIFVSAGWFW